MTHVVTANCADCRFTECTSVCPVACFHGEATRLYINPDRCIDCGACVPKCPVKAIYDSVDLEACDEHWIEANRLRALSLPVVRERSAALPGAEARRTALGF
jgi:ferredoxin